MSKKILASFKFERPLWKSGKTLVCGLDEVGRGCFAGPVVVGAVIFAPNGKTPKGIADSKVLPPHIREKLSEEIKKAALAWNVAEVEVETINRLGIGKATQLAFVKAVDNLKIKPDYLLIDAFYIQKIDKEIQLPIKHGDALSISIAAASIIAKVYRDRLMSNLAPKYQKYGFSQHKGYGTRDHRAAIKEFGLCDLHRTSFDLDKFL